MQTHIYECAKLTLDFIIMFMLSRYIFFIPPMEQKVKKFSAQFLFIFGDYLLLMILCLLTGIIPAFVFLNISMAAYCFLTAKKSKHSWLQALRFIPISGITYGLLMPLETFPAIILHLSQNAKECYNLALYLIFGVMLIGFVLFGREWRKNFRKELNYRKLETWEEVILSVIGILMYGFVAAIYSYGSINQRNFQKIALLESSVATVTGFAVTLTVIILILVGNKNAHIQQDLLEMQHNIIVTMADIVENRDESTGGHIRRTATYVQIIAETLFEEGWYQNIINPQYIKDIAIAAPLHDIGKIHVPDSILKKQGKLTDEEYAIMKSHTIEGRKLLLHAEKALGNFSYLNIAAEMAYCHHEWWNGKGYPQGISQQNIPLCARIMAVADVFDAIVSQRCYKGSMSLEEAYDIIRKESGEHFDPIVVEAFFHAKDRISQALTEFREPYFYLNEEK